MAPLSLTLSAACLLLFAGVRADSSSSSSDDDPSPLDVMEMGVQECVRLHQPAMISGGDYSELAKVLRLGIFQLTSCVSEGMEAMEAGTAPAAVAQQIVDCVGGKDFPPPLQPTVDAFLNCVRATLS